MHCSINLSGATRCAGRLLLGVLAAAFVSVAQAVVPTPTVIGPLASDVPGTPGRNYTFFATDVVLANLGYVEQEFFYDGTANRYDAPNPSGGVGNNAASATTANIVSSGHPFRSRLLVRRPADPARFNGTVIVEWLNVTNGYDTDVIWLYSKEFLVREGYAYVGVSAQNAGLNTQPNGIRNWSPTRYGSLNVNAGGTLPVDVLSYDIFSQAATAIRNVPAVLGGLQAAKVVGIGQSQSAGRLGIYMNAIHVRDPIYDGLIITEGGQIIRNDLTMPVIKILSETEYTAATNEIPVLQADTGKIRVWSVAGASHSDQYSLLSRAAFLLRDLGLPAQDACATPARSRVEMRYVYNAAMDAMVKWISGGPVPAFAPRIVFTSASPPVVPRDSFGHVQGGIRLSQIAVPVAKEAADTCFLGGTHVPFAAATVNTLYPTHGDYVTKVTLAANAAVAAGFMLPADAQQDIDKAQRSIWGMQLVCGPLCADVRQFPLNPSSMLLRNQTSFLMIKSAEVTLVPILDAVTLSLAQGYTLAAGSAASKQKFAQAASLLQGYITAVQRVLANGYTRPETASLLTNQATTLRSLVLAQSL